MRDGILFLDRRADFDTHLRTRRNGRYDLTVKAHQEKRSIPANRWYWKALLEAAADQTGDDKAAIHAWLKAQIVPTGEVSALGIPQTESTAEMTAERFSWYTERATALLAQHGVFVGGGDEVEV